MNIAGHEKGARRHTLSRRSYKGVTKFVVAVIAVLGAGTLLASDAALHFPLSLEPDDVLATGNEWVALPDIRASDGALGSFNVLSMRDRGLLEVTGDGAEPALQPYFMINGKLLPLRNLAWEVIEYWIPEARLTVNDVDVTLTYCAPPGSRGAFLRLTLHNRSSAAMPVVLGVKASWGGLNRVTYTPVALRGQRTVGPSPWVDSSEVFSFITDDTKFAWSLIHPGAEGHALLPPVTVSPSVDAQRSVTAGAGETVEAIFVLGVGLEEFSAPHSAKALREQIDRDGAERMIDRSAAWCRQRTRTTGRADLNLLMNRNFLFTEMYAWGRTIDTEQLVGVTSRSPRYYVSAAYWDRDAMLWSFPGLLDIDLPFAREALDYALSIQLRNTGTHSRFIDGAVLEDGFQLDEAVASLVATSEYVSRTNDDAFVASHRQALLFLSDRLFSRLDSQFGLYSSLQDSQDEYQKLPFLTYDNVLSWRAMLGLAQLFERMKDAANAADLKRRADALQQAILKDTVSGGAPGASDTIFASATDGKNFLFTDIPPGSLMKLPTLGFVPQDDPRFIRTYEWLHSKNYPYSYFDRPFGLPGSYRLPFTTSWTVADELRLDRGRERALKILLTSRWDAGIISEGVDPNSAVMDRAGRAFATAAGYVAHAICAEYCKNNP